MAAMGTPKLPFVATAANSWDGWSFAYAGLNGEDVRRERTLPPNAFNGDWNHHLPQERRHAGEGRGDGEPCVDTRTTELYDRRRVEVSLDEAEPIVI